MSECSICKWRYAWDCEDRRDFGNTENCKEFEIDWCTLTPEERRRYTIMKAAFCGEFKERD